MTFKTKEDTSDKGVLPLLCRLFVCEWLCVCVLLPLSIYWLPKLAIKKWFTMIAKHPPPLRTGRLLSFLSADVRSDGGRVWFIRDGTEASARRVQTVKKPLGWVKVHQDLEEHTPTVLNVEAFGVNLRIPLVVFSLLLKFQVVLYIRSELNN